MKPLSKNARLIVLLVACVGLMGALAYASVPLYTMFCQATGFGGTSRVSTQAPATTKDRKVTVFFDGNVDPSLPWDFAPEVRSVSVKLGEVVTVKYHAHNRGDKTTTGTAADNVQPDKAGIYFDKIQCFCFTKQILKPGETRELPVQFYVDPALADDPNAGDVNNITLSYTFYSAKNTGNGRQTTEDRKR